MSNSISQTVDGLKPPIGKEEKQTAEKSIKPTFNDTVAIKKIKEAIAIPIPGKDEYWKIQDLTAARKQGQGILGFLKKKSLSSSEINTLKKDAIQSPGNTRAKIKRLIEQYPNNSELRMLSAVCTSGMLLNSSNREEIIRGLKFAVKEAATALVSGGISVYNAENFFIIYYSLLDRFKRAQVKALGVMKEEPRLAGSQSQLIISMKIVEHLISEKKKVMNIINHLKKKLKSSLYIARFSPIIIKEAVNYIEKGSPKENCKIGTATETISYVYALAIAFARIPILSPLVNKILRLMPDKNVSLLIRKISINSARKFNTFKLAAIESDREEMVSIAQSIIKDNLTAVQKMGGQSVSHAYEADVFFNVAFITELTTEIFKGGDHARILDKAIQAMESLVEKDMSKGHTYTEVANVHIRKLTSIREGIQDGA